MWFTIGLRFHHSREYASEIKSLPLGGISHSLMSPPYMKDKAPKKVLHETEATAMPVIAVAPAVVEDTEDKLPNIPVTI
jgi:hypothetical protein